MKKAIAVLIALLSLSCDIKMPKRVQIGATVKEKAAARQQHSGIMEYHTIVLTDDGYLEDIEGLRAYASPIGSHITVTVVR